MLHKKRSEDFNLSFFFPLLFQIRGLLDLVTMQLKVECRSRGGWERTREEMSRTLYDTPRRLEEEEEVESETKKASEAMTVGAEERRRKG